MNVNSLLGKSMMLCVFLLFCNLHLTNAQVGIGTSTPDASSAIDVTSTSAGALFPRMTTLQRNAISAPAAGLLIYNISTSTFDYNLGPDGTANWVSLSTGGAETRAVKYNNGSGGTVRNLNVGGGVNVEIFQVAEFNDDTSLYVFNDAESLTITEAGRYRITFNLSIEEDVSDAGDEAINVSVTVNGTEVGTFVNHSVITGSGGHRLSSLNATQVFDLAANSVIRLISFQEAAAGTISLDDQGTGLSDILIEKIN